MKRMNFLRSLAMVSIVLCLFGIMAGCKKEEQSRIKIYEYREQIGKKMKEVDDLKNASVYGIKKGMFPITSKSLLENTWANLKKLLQEIKEQGWGDEQIITETQARIARADQQLQAFKATVLDDDIVIKAELEVNGKNGGYIDFGVHPEYSSFGSQGHQKFTIDCWIKLKDLEGFFFLLSTFIDDEDNDHQRQGWCINSYNFGSNTIRMTYGMGFNDLMEPGTPFTTVNEWVHLAVVTNEDGVDNEFENGRPIMTKIYINGELKLKTISHQQADRPYASNDRAIAMVAFTGLNTLGQPIGDKSANGYLKDLHIWRASKSMGEIKSIMDNPDAVSGLEDDLVCGWRFDTIAENDNSIMDITGKYAAKLIGDYNWITKEE